MYHVGKSADPRLVRVSAAIQGIHFVRFYIFDLSESHSLQSVFEGTGIEENLKWLLCKGNAMCQAVFEYFGVIQDLVSGAMHRDTQRRFADMVLFHSCRRAYLVPKRVAFQADFFQAKKRNIFFLCE
jgi:hypothetical protein